MPFDLTQRVVYGPDARKPELWARDTLRDWLRGVLNDANGPYAELLHLRLTGAIAEQRKAIVTDNKKIARTMSAAKTAPPVVFLHKSNAGDWVPYRKEIAGTLHEGRRYDQITIHLDMGVSDATPNQIDVVKEEGDEDALGAFARDAVRNESGFMALNALGLNNPNLEQGEAGTGRSPHIFTCFIKTLDSWTP